MAGGCLCRNADDRELGAGVRRRAARPDTASVFRPGRYPASEAPQSLAFGPWRVQTPLGWPSRARWAHIALQEPRPAGWWRRYGSDMVLRREDWPARWLA